MLRPFNHLPANRAGITAKAGISGREIVGGLPQKSLKLTLQVIAGKSNEEIKNLVDELENQRGKERESTMIRFTYGFNFSVSLNEDEEYWWYFRSKMKA